MAKKEGDKEKMSRSEKLKKLVKEFRRNLLSFVKDVGGAGTGQQVRAAKKTSNSLPKGKVGDEETALASKRKSTTKTAQKPRGKSSDYMSPILK